MRERYVVVLLVLGVSGLLWYGIARFVHGTDGLPDQLGIQDAERLDLEAMAAKLEAERLELEENPPPEVRPSVEAGPEAAEHEAGDAEFTVATVEDEDEDEEGNEDEDEGETDEEEPPERPDSDADMRKRGADGEREATVEIDARDAELARLLAELDEDLLDDAPATRAVDVGLSPALAAGCPSAAGARLRTGVLFRHGSASIKGRSLNRIDEVLALRKACGGGEVLVEPNPQGDADGDAELAGRRRDEVKYYLLQRRVPAADIAFRERS